ncbi:MAG: hypothetical protein K2N58_05835 [Treponemataceae bacterium]|nr:hypothetical protein [Treponemataceae bacterium]
MPTIALAQKSREVFAKSGFVLDTALAPCYNNQSSSVAGLAASAKIFIVPHQKQM